MKIEISTIVLILVLLVFGLWMDKPSRKRPTMREVDRAIFDGK